MKKNLKNEQGFTLVEILIVLVIAAVISASIVPALIGFVSEAKKEKAILECHSAITAAQSLAIELYSENALTYDNLTDAIGNMEELAEVDSGSIEEVHSDDGANIIYLSYISKDGIRVIYKNNEFFFEDADAPANCVSEYIRECEKLFPGIENKKAWNFASVYRQIFKDEHDGVFPSLTDEEKAMLLGAYAPDVAIMTWKPVVILSSDGTITDIIFSASSDKLIDMSYMIYYNGDYYIHENSGGYKISSYVPPGGNFDLNILNTFNSGGGWVKVSK